MSKNIEISVKDLLGFFRGAIKSLIPWLEKAHIEWEEGKASDDWDAIVEALYQSFIGDSLHAEFSEVYNILKYNSEINNVSSVDYIEVKSKNFPDSKFAFISFLNNSFEFDDVVVAELDDNDRVKEFTNLNYEASEFIFVKRINKSKTYIENIDILL